MLWKSSASESACGSEKQNNVNAFCLKRQSFQISPQRTRLIALQDY